MGRSSGARPDLHDMPRLTQIGREEQEEGAWPIWAVLKHYRGSAPATTHSHITRLRINGCRASD